MQRISLPSRARAFSTGMLFCLILVATAARAQPPVLESVFPAGGHVGKSVTVEVGGSNLPGVRSLVTSADGVRCERLDDTHYRLDIPAAIPPGLYDVWAAGAEGISA